jgi:rod shape-determining protein MreB and related proteins
MAVFNSLKNLLTVDLGVDLGTSRTRVYLRGTGVVLDEPSFVAVSHREGKVVAVGREAYKMFGRCPPHVEVLKPLSKGTIENFDLAESMLREFLDNIFRRKALLGARISMVVPSGATDVEKKAFEDVAMQVGGREVFLIEAPVAAAIGIGLPIEQARGIISFYLGGGTTQSAVFAGGEVLLTQSSPVGGDDLTEAIVSGIRKKHKVLIGNHTAEQLKVSLGCAMPLEKDETREVYGKNVMDGLPRAVFVSGDEVREMMLAPLNQIANTIKQVLERIPPELAEDVQRNGLYLSGGNSQVRGISRLFEEITGVKCVTSKKGQLSCIMGAERIINDLKRYDRLTTSSHSRKFTSG